MGHHGGVSISRSRPLDMKVKILRMLSMVVCISRPDGRLKLLSPLLQVRWAWACIWVVVPKTCLCPGCHMPDRWSVLTGRASARDHRGLGRGPGVWGRLATAVVLANPQRSRGEV